MPLYLQSCLRAGYPLERDSEMLKTRLKKRVVLVTSLLPKRVIKNAFQQSAFCVSHNVIFRFSHKLRVSNAICVAYRVVGSYMYVREATILSDKDILVCFK